MADAHIPDKPALEGLESKWDAGACHVTAEVPVFLQSFALGRKLVLMPKWNADEAMRLIQDEKCNYFVGVPLMSYEILVSPNRKNYDLSTCKSYAGGGAPRPPEHVRR